jgi:hypothetical protein
MLVSGAMRQQRTIRQWEIERSQNGYVEGELSTLKFQLNKRSPPQLFSSC